MRRRSRTRIPRRRRAACETDRVSPSPAQRAKAFVRRHGGAVMGSVTSTSSPDVVLTFDDGPDPHETQRVLEVLERHGATATFFVLLSRVREHPDQLADVLAEGHEVALHGVDHRALTCFDGTEAKRRTAAARAELEDATGRVVRWYRPPYGRQNPFTWAAVRGAGLVPVLWNATTGDSQPLSRQERLRRATAGGRSGAIVLAHDGIADRRDGVDDPPAPLADRAGHVDEVLSGWGDRGLRARSLGDVLADGARLGHTLELTQFGRERDPRFR